MNNNLYTASLKPVLGLRDLIIYGIIMVQLVAPVPIYGLVQIRSGGNALPTILFAMVGMLFTAISYGRMTALYPVAGSAYTYVSRSIHSYPGFLIGWAMVLDYMVIPLISIIIPALILEQVLPEIPFPILTLLVILIMTLLNLRGIKTTNKANITLLLVTSAAIFLFIVMSIKYLYAKGGVGALFSFTPFYNPNSFDVGKIITGTSLAALTYIGFDGVTTLAEDTKNPRRNILIATVSVCLITGVVSVIELYFFQMVWADWTTHSNPDTAYLEIMKLAGGTLLFSVFSVVMSLSQFGSGLTGQVGAARLLYGMGRDNVIPKRIFGVLSRVQQTPVYNIWIVGFIAFVGSVFLPLGNACDLLNFGAFLGYMGVNLSVIWSYYLRPPAGYNRHIIKDLILPGFGFLFCILIWIGLPNVAQITGAAWLMCGVLVLAYKTKGFKQKPELFDFDKQ